MPRQCGGKRTMDTGARLANSPLVFLQARPSQRRRFGARHRRRTPARTKRRETKRTRDAGSPMVLCREPVSRRPMSAISDCRVPHAANRSDTDRRRPLRRRRPRTPALAARSYCRAGGSTRGPMPCGPLVFGERLAAPHALQRDVRRRHPPFRDSLPGPGLGSPRAQAPVPAAFQDRSGSALLGAGTAAM